MACGTGYWTSVAASTAQRITATDINPETLRIAETKSAKCPVEFIEADAFHLPTFDQKFDCGMAHFWLSHIPKATLSVFLKNFAAKLQPNATLLFIDSRYVAGYRTPPSRVDDKGNSYSLRRLKNGSTYEIVKNYLSKEDILSILEPLSKSVEFSELDYLWSAKAIL